jgi:hypothetical protein
MMATKDATLMMLPPWCKPFSGSALFCEETLSDVYRGAGDAKDRHEATGQAGQKG